MFEYVSAYVTDLVIERKAAKFIKTKNSANVNVNRFSGSRKEAGKLN